MIGMTRRVVITGMGMITPVGHNKTEFWNNLLQGKSGIGPIDRFDASRFPTRIAAQVEGFNAQDYIPRAEARRMDRFTQLACSGARLALEDAQLVIKPEDSYRAGVWIGSGIGGIETFEKQHVALINRGAGGVSPFFIPMLIPNMASGQVAIMSGARGPSGCTVTACASGANSIGEAFNLIRWGKAEVMLTGGSESCITPTGIAGFCSMKAMSTRNDEPTKACRPFDADRDGFVMGEGSGVLILEELQHAQERGAHIYAEIIGYGGSTDAVHMVQPDPEGKGAAIAIRAALDDAAIQPQEVDYINAHGTGTGLNDLAETLAIKEVFGSHSRNLKISSTKPYTGHMLGAAGAVEAIASVLALINNTVPATLNLETADPQCDLDYTPLKSCQAELNTVISESLGFGGHNAVLVIRKVR